MSHHLPGLDLSVVRSCAQRVLRTPQVISHAVDDYFIVSLQTCGNGVISQDGRDARMAPGDFSLYDSTRPYTLSFDGEFEQIVLKVRSESLRPLVRNTEQLTATTVSGRTGAGHLLINMIETLRSEVDTLLARLNHMVTTPASVEALWLAAGLAVLAIGFAVTRAMEEF